jgi:hypothetical protein
LWHFNAVAQIAAQDPFAVAKSEKDAQVSAQVPPSSRGQIRYRIHDKRSQQCGRQFRERTDAHLVKVLLERV